MLAASLWNNDLTEIAPILSPIYKRANSNSIAQRPCSVPETLWETPDSKPQKSGALPMSHHISTKRHRQQWATTSPPNDKANNAPPYFSPNEPTHLRQWVNTSPIMIHHTFLPMSHQIFDYWATTSSITEPPYSISNQKWATPSQTKQEPPHLQ